MAITPGFSPGISTQPINKGGTGATTATGARSNLGVAAAVNPSTDNAIVRFDGTAGEQQNSGVTISDGNIVTVPGAIEITGEDSSKFQRVSDAGITNNIRVINTGAGLGTGARLGFSTDGTNDNEFIQSVFADGTLKHNLVLGVGGGSGVDGVPQLTLAGGGLARLHAYGAGTLTTDSSGNVTATSDERVKDNLTPFTKGLAAVLQLTPKRYNWKASTGLNTDDVVVSLTAQNLIAAGVTEAVSTYRTVPVMEDVEIPAVVVDGVETSAARTERRQVVIDGVPQVEQIDATYTVSDRAVIAVLVNAIKELAAKVAALEAAA